MVKPSCRLFSGCVAYICCNFVWICLCLCTYLSKWIPFRKGYMTLVFLHAPVGDVNLLVWRLSGNWELLMPQSFYHHPVSVCKECHCQVWIYFWLMECVGIVLFVYSMHLLFLILSDLVCLECDLCCYFCDCLIVEYWGRSLNIAQPNSCPLGS